MAEVKCACKGVQHEFRKWDTRHWRCIKCKKMLYDCGIDKTLYDNLNQYRMKIMSLEKCLRVLRKTLDVNDLE